jgi:phosphosulfolactate synthase
VVRSVRRWKWHPARSPVASSPGGIKAVSPRNFSEYLAHIGVADLTATSCPFDPGLAPVVLESHLAQSADHILSLKISMACWMVADDLATRRKLAAAAAVGVQTSAGGGPYEVAAAQGCLPEYLDLCADVGFFAIECGSGFTSTGIPPGEVAAMIGERGLVFDYELGEKHGGEFSSAALSELIDDAHRWLEVGARRLVIEARESARGIGLFDATGALDTAQATRLVDEFGLTRLVFEAPTKSSQFALIDHLGPEVRLGNIPMDELLRVEIYRRGLHSDAYGNPRLRPRSVSHTLVHGST